MRPLTGRIKIPAHRSLTPGAVSRTRHPLSAALLLACIALLALPAASRAASSTERSRCESCAGSLLKVTTPSASVAVGFESPIYSPRPLPRP